MTSIIQTLTKQKLIQPPQHVTDGIQLEVIVGSASYGVSGDASDVDVMGFSIPNKELVFPHLNGEIPGFGTQIQRFQQFQQHHVKSADGQNEYDVSIYSIVKFFQLCMENNPNMIDSLFVPDRCVLFSTPIGLMVRESRTMFLHKGSYHKFRGYAYSQKSKIKEKVNFSNPKRAADVEKHGYSTKYAYHLVRLANEAEQILMTGTLDLEQNREQLKSIRRGEWTLEQIETWFKEKEKQLDQLYITSTLRHNPDEDAIKALLLNCLEQHYGSLSNMIEKPSNTQLLINQLKDLIAKWN